MFNNLRQSEGRLLFCDMLIPKQKADWVHGVRGFFDLTLLAEFVWGSGCYTCVDQPQLTFGGPNRLLDENGNSCVKPTLPNSAPPVHNVQGHNDILLNTFFHTMRM